MVHVTKLLPANLLSGKNLLISALEAALVGTGGFLLHVHFFLLLRAFAVLSFLAFVPKHHGVSCGCILLPVWGIMDCFVQQELFECARGPRVHYQKAH